MKAVNMVNNDKIYKVTLGNQENIFVTEFKNFLSLYGIKLIDNNLLSKLGEQEVKLYAHKIGRFFEEIAEFGYDICLSVVATFSKHYKIDEEILIERLSPYVLRLFVSIERNYESIKRSKKIVTLEKIISDCNECQKEKINKVINITDHDMQSNDLNCSSLVCPIQLLDKSYQAFGDQILLGENLFHIYSIYIDAEFYIQTVKSGELWERFNNWLDKDQIKIKSYFDNWTPLEASAYSCGVDPDLFVSIENSTIQFDSDKFGHINIPFWIRDRIIRLWGLFNDRIGNELTKNHPYFYINILLEMNEYIYNDTKELICSRFSVESNKKVKGKYSALQNLLANVCGDENYVTHDSKNLNLGVAGLSKALAIMICMFFEEGFQGVGNVTFNATQIAELIHKYCDQKEISKAKISSIRQDINKILNEYIPKNILDSLKTDS